MNTPSPLQQAIQIAGGQTALAVRLGMGKKGQKNVWAWLNLMNGRVTADVAVKIERALDGKVTKEQLRPDLFTEDAE